MRKIKRAAAGFLAAVMLLTGTLAINASADEVSEEYETLRRRASYSDSEQEFYTIYDELLRKYPDSPELYYERAVYRWEEDETAGHGEAARQLVLADLDKTIELALRTERPYQESFTEYFDYGSMAAQYKAIVYQSVQGAQDSVNAAEQQYADLLDRWVRIQLKREDCDESDRESYNQYLNHDIPNVRAELENIKSWNASGNKSYTAWAAAGADPYYRDIEWCSFNVTGGVGSKTVKISATYAGGTSHEHVYTFSQPVKAVQRSLHGVTFFVPNGTTVKVQDGTKNKDCYVGVEGNQKYTYSMTLNQSDPVYSSLGSSDWDFDSAIYLVNIVAG